VLPFAPLLNGLIGDLGLKKLSLFFFAGLLAASSACWAGVTPKGASHYKIRWEEVEKPPSATGAAWDGFRRNMSAQGFTDLKIEHETIAGLENGFPRVLQSAAHTLELNAWDFEKRLTRAHYEKLADAHDVGSQLLANLGFLLEIENFKVEKFLSAVFRPNGQLSVRDTSLLLGWSHLWIESPRAVDWALRILDASDDWAVVWWFIDRLPEADRDRFGEQISQRLQAKVESSRTTPLSEEADFLITAAAYVPELYQPLSFKRRLARMGWNGNSPRAAYPALVTDQIQLLLHESYYAGNCSQMSYGHFGTLGVIKPRVTELWKNTILISVGGAIVGAMKRVGDSSMVALRNVRNSDGKQVLSIGGVYLLPLGLVPLLPFQTGEDGTWVAVELSELRVKPHQFLMNQNAWDHFNTDQWRRDLGVTKTRAIEMGENKFQEMTVEAVLKNLDCVRALLEQGRK